MWLTLTLSLEHFSVFLLSEQKSVAFNKKNKQTKKTVCWANPSNLKQTLFLLLEKKKKSHCLPFHQHSSLRNFPAKKKEDRFGAAGGTGLLIVSCAAAADADADWKASRVELLQMDVLRLFPRNSLRTTLKSNMRLAKVLLLASTSSFWNLTEKNKTKNKKIKQQCDVIGKLWLWEEVLESLQLRQEV